MEVLPIHEEFCRSWRNYTSIDWQSLLPAVYFLRNDKDVYVVSRSISVNIS